MQIVMIEGPIIYKYNAPNSHLVWKGKVGGGEGKGGGGGGGGGTTYNTVYIYAPRNIHSLVSVQVQTMQNAKL